MYILTAINYFSKCVEAIALKEVKKENMVNFILTDNGKPFDE